MIEFVLYVFVYGAEVPHDYSKQLGRYTTSDHCVQNASNFAIEGTGDPIIDRNDVLFVCKPEKYF